MIDKQVVLILGAGASRPYGLPLGVGLIEDIHKMGWGRPMVPLCQNITCLPFGGDKLLDFQRALKKAATPSIDAFLARQEPDLLRMGKQIVAYVLSFYETDQYLYDEETAGEHNKRWYWFLFKLLAENRFNGPSPVNVITYNYDRSLEFFLFNALRQHFPKETEQECENILSRIQIIHLHGTLGRPAFREGSPGRSYTPIKGAEDLKTASDGIKVISEVVARTPEYDRAHRLLSDADSIVFLGFGFDAANMERLAVAKHAKAGAQVFCTTHGLTEEEKEFYVRRKLKPLTVSAWDWGCLQLLREKLTLFYN